MTKKDRYLALAAKYKPEDVEAVPVQKHESGYLAIAYTEEEFDEEVNELSRKMQVPVPDTLGGLWIYLHECAHFRLNHRNITPGTNDYSRAEAEAELEVMRIFDEEVLTAPLWVLKAEFATLRRETLFDDKLEERHPTATRALEEFERRIKAAENRK
jgi:hypothetical protein